MADAVRFQAIGESLPVLRIESGASGKPRGPVEPKRVEVMAKKAKLQMMKMMTNLVLEMLIREL